jgi:hypothetical protein
MTASFIDQNELRLLQGLFLILVVAGIGMRAIDGGSLLETVVGGGVVGGLAFLPIALLYFIYLFGKRRSPKGA